jgi:hypothetical protein
MPPPSRSPSQGGSKPHYRGAVPTDWTYRPGRGEAVVAIHDPSDQYVAKPLAVVSWKGDDHLIPYVPVAYFDKIFCNLRNDRAGADDLLRRVVRFVDEIDETNWNTMFAGLAELLADLILSPSGPSPLFSLAPAYR